MPHRISIQSTIPDARAKRYFETLTERFPKAALQDASVSICYTIDGKLSAGELRKVSQDLTDAITETTSTRTILTSKSFTYAIEIGFLPGVTDNVGNTVSQMIADTISKPLESIHVYSSLFLFLSGNLKASEVTRMAGELHNPLIESAHVYTFKDFTSVSSTIHVPKVVLSEKADVLKINLDIPDEELVKIGKEGIAGSDGIRRGPLALSLAELSAIKEHFKKAKRLPTDIEIESLAQTWSEHCKHTIFSDPLDDISEGIYRHYIKGATVKIRKAKGKQDFCASVFTDNSGAIHFDEKYLITHKVETHNSPSALDPYGGAMTGIVGVNRDALGFGLGAKAIANVYGFCVADPRDTSVYFRDTEKTQELLPARRILSGVVRGINGGGNQSGIPTPLGFIYTDPRFRGKPLVFAGTVGILPRRSAGRDLTKKSAKVGDYIVSVGGRVGLDGIHGATFSSEALQSGSPATAVQIGDPITQKKFSDVIAGEARDQNLYNSITDNGAGGISCAVAEMARECGGCSVELEKVPLKYPGLAPWQIWISESQERMTLAVPKDKWLRFKKLMESRGVEAMRIGTFTNSGKCTVTYEKKKIMDIDLEFLHDGRPPHQQVSKKPTRVLEEPSAQIRRTDIRSALLAVLEHPNLASYSYISKQYDHEVQGTSVTKPLQGAGLVNSDAAVLRPIPESIKGVVLAQGYAPAYSDIDSYAMAAAALDTSIRNAICAGANPDHLAILDNFCWSSGNSPERLYELKEAARACYEGAVAHGAPFISGKDSMFNDFKGFTPRGDSVHIAAPPTLLVSAISVMKDVRNANTLDLKTPGDILFILGETNNELGGSEYFNYLSIKNKKKYTGTTVPQTDFAKNAQTYRVLAGAIESGLVSAAIGISRGGLSAAILKMSLAGGLGTDIQLEKLPGKAKELDTKLFSESQGRVIVSVSPRYASAFKKLLQSSLGKNRYAEIGTVTNKNTVTFKETDKTIAELELNEIARTYHKVFKDF